MLRFVILTCFPFLLLAQPKPLDTVLYGASYYHEYMPYERLDKDVELMQKAGITVVRVGESTWTSWEPRDGQFEFAWMDRVLDRLHQAGIKVILGTPTYSIPPWLYKEHPEILVTRVERPESDLRHPAEHGHLAPDLPQYAERVIRQIVAHFKDHPAVIGYQIDNETAPTAPPAPMSRQAFIEHLKEKFGTTEAMNRLGASSTGDNS